MKIKPVTNCNVLPKSGTNGQLKRINDEWVEAVEAYLSGNITHADEEVMDIIVACRTYFHLRGMTDEMVDNVYKAVEDKNAKRGYYDFA